MSEIVLALIGIIGVLVTAFVVVVKVKSRNFASMKASANPGPNGTRLQSLDREFGEHLIRCSDRFMGMAGEMGSINASLKSIDSRQASMERKLDRLFEHDGYKGGD